jgi:hypothetical protein
VLHLRFLWQPIRTEVPRQCLYCEPEHLTLTISCVGRKRHAPTREAEPDTR